MESDEGTFTPEGLYFSGNNRAACILQEILRYWFKIYEYIVIISLFDNKVESRGEISTNNTRQQKSVLLFCHSSQLVFFSYLCMK